MNTRSGLILAVAVGVVLVGVLMGGMAFLAAPILLVAVLIAGVIWWMERRAQGKEPGHEPRDHP